MRSLVFAATFFFVIISWGEEKKDLSGFQTMDMKQFEGLEKADSNNKIKLSVTCKTEDGKVLKASDPEYQSCLTKVQNKAK